MSFITCHVDCVKSLQILFDEVNKLTDKVTKLEEKQHHDKERINYVNNLIIKYQNDIEKLQKYHVSQIDENRKVSRRIDELEEQMKSQFEEKDFYKTHVKEKKSGLSFKESTILCKQGEKLRRSGWSFSNFLHAYLYFDHTHGSIKIYLDDTFNATYPKYEDIITDDWEIIE